MNTNAIHLTGKINLAKNHSRQLVEGFHFASISQISTNLDINFSLDTLTPQKFVKTTKIDINVRAAGIPLPPREEEGYLLVLPILRGSGANVIGAVIERSKGPTPMVST